MIYSEFMGKKLSKLGFGCMRFKNDPATGEIDQEKVNEMFRLALEGGVNYFDTAYPYLGGKSELAMAEALRDQPRESYFLADKFPGHSLPGPVDNIALFKVSLEKCRTDYFDFYLLHNLNEWTEKIYESEEYHILPDMLQMKKEGHIRHLGFSFHGGNELLEEYLTRHEGVFDFVQIQLNYLDWTLQKAKEKYDIITRHGLAVWVMEPCRGGKLAALPEEASAKLRALDKNAGDASFAFRFLESLPNVKVILSGMNEPEQVKENLATFREEKPLTKAEEDVLFGIAESMKKSVPCTACRYCTAGCPKGLNIPMLMECYNDYTFAAGVNSAMRLDGLDEDKRPDACIACGKCKRACPQGIDIPKVIAALDEMYKKGPQWSVFSAPRKESIKKDLHMGE